MEPTCTTNRPFSMQFKRSNNSYRETRGATISTLVAAVFTPLLGAKNLGGSFEHLSLFIFYVLCGSILPSICL